MDRPRLLERCLDSVFAQTLLPAKVVVVDNGIRAAEVPDRYSDRVTLLRTVPRFGGGSARNLGAALIGTEWIAFIDDDDTWHPEYLGLFERCIRERSPDVVVGALVAVDEAGVEGRAKILPSEPERQRQIYFRNPGFSGQNIAVKSSVFHAIRGFDPRMPASQDLDLAARLMQAHARIVVEPRARAFFHKHGGPRITDRIIQGNVAFLARHWRSMRLGEIARAVRRIVRRKLAAARGLSPADVI